MKEQMTPADPPEEASTVKKMNGRSLLPSLNKMTSYFKDWKTPSGVLKNIYCLYKKLTLQMDLLTVAVAKNFSTPKEN